MLNDVRFALRLLDAQPGADARGGAVARARHRREHHHLHADQPGVPAAAAARGAVAAGLGLHRRRAQPAAAVRRLHADVAAELRGLSREERDARGARRAGFHSPSACQAGSGEPEQVVGRDRVRPGISTLLGAPMAVGRGFHREEERTIGAAPVDVLSYGLWQRRFGGDRGVVGRTITINAPRLHR